MKLLSAERLQALGYSYGDSRRIMQNLANKKGISLVYKQEMKQRKSNHIRGKEGLYEIRYVDVDSAIKFYQSRLCIDERPNARKHSITYLRMLTELRKKI